MPALPLPANARRRMILDPLSPARRRALSRPESASSAHPLRKRSRNVPRSLRHVRRVLHAEFRERFTEQARDAAERADAIIAVSAFTDSRYFVVGRGRRRVSSARAPRPPSSSGRRATHDPERRRSRTQNIARLVEAFEPCPIPGGWCWRARPATGARKFLPDRRQPGARAYPGDGLYHPEELAGWYAERRSLLFRLSTKVSACRCWKPWPQAFRS